MMAEVPGQLQCLHFALGPVELAQHPPGAVDTSVVNKKQEAVGCYLSLFPQLAQHADQPPGRLPDYKLFVEAGNNDR